MQIIVLKLYGIFFLLYLLTGHIIMFISFTFILGGGVLFKEEFLLYNDVNYFNGQV